MEVKMIRYILVLFFVTTSLFGVVKEAAHFRDLAEYASADTVILLDIDDTLMAPKQMLGSDTWFEYRLKQYQTEGNDFSPALEKTLAEWEAIRHLSQMQLVEVEIRDVLTSLQERNISMMGLTVQGLALATRTVLQLRDHEIDLSRTSFCNEDCCFPVQGHTVLYRQGILFTSGKSKGESFFQLCERIGQMPKRIVAIDDKLSHLQNIEKEAAKRGVEFVGLRYSYSDERKAAFSSSIAEYQLTHSTLTRLLSDEEAGEAMKKGE